MLHLMPVTFQHRNISSQMYQELRPCFMLRMKRILVSCTISSGSTVSISSMHTLTWPTRPQRMPSWAGRRITTWKPQCKATSLEIGTRWLPKWHKDSELSSSSDNPLPVLSGKILVAWKDLPSSCFHTPTWSQIRWPSIMTHLWRSQSMQRRTSLESLQWSKLMMDKIPT